MPFSIPTPPGLPSAPDLNFSNVYDPMAGIRNAYAIAEAEGDIRDKALRSKINQMKLADMQREAGIQAETEAAGKSLLFGTPKTTTQNVPVQPPPAYTDMMRGATENVLGPNYSPQVTGARTTPNMLQTPMGPVSVEEAQKNPAFYGRQVMQQRVAEQAQRTKEIADKRTDARKRIDDMIEKGNSAGLQAYRQFLSTDPTTADLAEATKDIKLTGMGQYEGQKFYTTEQLKAIDPEGKMTDGTPGLYDLKVDGMKKSLKKIKTDRDMLVNSAANGTPQEQEWAKRQLQGRAEYEPVTDFRTFRVGELEKVKREHPKWSGAEVESEVWKRYRKAIADIQVNVAKEKAEEAKKIWEPEAQKIGDAIISGKQPPELSGWGMAKIAPQTRSYLADKGYDFTAANLDWIAQKKYMQTLNGPQQTRLRQATQFAYDSLDVVERLAKQWDAGPYPILNKANMLLAKQGAYGQEAAKIATQLETQIADLTSELGTVYKGGNSSTDESLKLAATNLNGNWSRDVLEGNIELTRNNLKIRLNSIKHTGPITATGVGIPGAKPEEKPKVEQRKPGETIADYLKRTSK